MDIKKYIRDKIEQAELKVQEYQDNEKLCENWKGVLDAFNHVYNILVCKTGKVVTGLIPELSLAELTVIRTLMYQQCDKIEREVKQELTK